MDIRDYKLRGADEATLRAALEAVGIIVPAEARPPFAVIECQQPQWSLAWLGALYSPVVLDPETTEPVSGGELLPGFHADLRWIGPNAPDLASVEVTPEPDNPLHGWA